MTDKPPRKPHTLTPRKTDDVDRVIAAKISRRRVALNMTRVQLAKQLGMTWQQVQKYESGSNRVAASTLFKVAKALGVPISYFYEGAGEIDKIEIKDDVERLIAGGGRDLAADYLVLPNPQRKMVASLARSLATEQTDKDIPA